MRALTGVWGPCPHAGRREGYPTGQTMQPERRAVACLLGVERLSAVHGRRLGAQARRPRALPTSYGPQAVARPGAGGGSPSLIHEHKVGKTDGAT